MLPGAKLLTCAIPGKRVSRGSFNCQRISFTSKGDIKMDRARQGLNRERLQHIAGLFLLIFSFVLYGMFLWKEWYPVISSQSIWSPHISTPVALDFPLHWTASHLALAGEPASVYDYEYFAKVEKELTGIGPHPWPYPPTALLIDLPLSLLPYFVSLAVWLAVTMSLYLLVLYGIAPHPAVFLWALGFFGTFQNFYFGQNGFISATLLGGGLLLLQSSPFLGGILLGLVSYKPHIAVLIPLALVLGRQWRALGGAVLAAAVLALASVLVFGFGIWMDFFASIPNTMSNLRGTDKWFFKMPSVYAAARLAGYGSKGAWIFHSLSMLGGVALMVWMWAKRTSWALRNSALVLAILLFSPHIWYYDVVLLALALAWLWQEGNTAGWLPWEKPLLLFAWFLPLLAFLLMVGLRWSVGPLYLAMTLVIVVRRYWWEQHYAPATQEILPNS